MLSTRFLLRLLFTLSCVLLVSSCTTQRLFINSDIPVIADDAKFILLPTDIHGLSGSKVEKESVLYTSFTMAFGDRKIDTPALSTRLKMNGFGDVSWQMSHAMHQIVTDQECFSYTQAYQLGLENGQVNSKFRSLGQDLEQLSLWLKQAYQLTSVPDYIVVAHIDSMGVSNAGKLIKYRVIAGIYSTQRQALERVVSYVTESPNHQATIFHELDNLGFLIYRELFTLSISS